MANFVTIKRSHLFPSFVASIFCFLLLMATVPIKWTPMVAILPEYNTWHQVSSVHLMKILWRSVPSGVSPIKNCSRFNEPAVPRRHMEQYNIQAFSYTSSEAAINAMKNKRSHPVLKRFLPLLDKNTKIMLLHTYAVLEKALKKAGVNHVLLHGSLFGVYRFSGIQPWDDDLDIGINVSKWSHVRNALSCIKGFELFVDPTMRWSFFPSDGLPSSSMVGKKYPFIDIFFQAEDDTHVWGLQFVNRRRSLFPKSLVFPISWAYLDGLRVPVPNNVPQILRTQYGDLDVCATQEYGHLLPSKIVHTVPCSLLYPVYGNFSRS